MPEFLFDMSRYHALARQAAAEGCVLLKNDQNALPLRKGECISVFGRIAWNYYKSGTGSGGLVNTRYVTGILDALRACGNISLNEDLVSTYERWIADHPFEYGEGWGGEPWCQEEMPLTDELVEEAAKSSDSAIVILGRTAGEDRDASATEGSFLLTETEKDMLKKVCNSFSRSIVLLNVGNIIDMNWVKEFDPSAVLYVWQGGQEGGNGVLDVLTGKVSPCGKLTDTIANSIASYPSSPNFGDPHQNIFYEDIYVGYRYFETFCPEKVFYPFGFGLSYTQFTLDTVSSSLVDMTAHISVAVKNTGAASGKEVVQIYCTKPQGKLGKPVKELVAYQKTPLLAPGETVILIYHIGFSELSSYDDSGASGYQSSWVLEDGKYFLEVGTNVRSTAPALEFVLPKTIVTEQLREACSPTVLFNRIKPTRVDGKFIPTSDPVPIRSYSLASRIANRVVPDMPYTGNCGFILADVCSGRCTMEDFTAQFSDEELCCLVRGEGMSSPKATPGTAAAIGGVSSWAQKYGIPIGCFSDGPSGIRMDCGTKATSLPNGTALGCTWNDSLIEELFTYVGFELRKFHIDSLLGPGINIHRNPLCGRNFEYVSEDPYISGMIASAQLKGMAKAGVTGTIKHLAVNSQEYLRKENDSVLSERALREIYLKAFEICVKCGGAYSVMTSYNAVNGIWAAGNFDLVAVILREQMGYRGLVMTDWWASMNEMDEMPSARNTHLMVRSQNDIFMVAEDSERNSLGDLSLQGLQDGTVKRGDFLLAAEDILRFLMRSPAMLRSLGLAHPVSFKILEDPDHAPSLPDCEVLSPQFGGLSATPGMEKYFRVQGSGDCTISFHLVSNAKTELAQGSMSIFYEDALVKTFTWKGSNTQICTIHLNLSQEGTHLLKLYFPIGGVSVTSIRTD